MASQGFRNILKDGDYLLRPHRILITVGDPIFPENNDFKEIVRLRNKARKQILQHCGEPSLHFIVAGTPASKITH